MPVASEPIRVPRNNSETGGGCGSMDECSQSIDKLIDLEANSDSAALRTDDTMTKVVTSYHIPGDLLYGETLDSSAPTSSGHLYLTQYRICIVELENHAIANIPLASVDSIEIRDPNVLQINSKYGRVFRVRAASSESAVELYKKLTQVTCSLRIVDDAFAGQFAKIARKEDSSKCWIKWEASDGDQESSASTEFERLKFDPKRWRISDINKDYEFLDSYPQQVIVPIKVSDEEIRQASEGRYHLRFPAVVWRCEEKDTVLLRSSQPRCGIFSYRYSQDEHILDCVQKALPEAQSSNTLLIIDARYYTAAIANWARGGGFESQEYYPKTEVQFMGLPNIHYLRDSFQQLRKLLSAVRDPQTYLQSLQTTKWFQYLSSLLESAQRCVGALFDEGRSVLVHCSDGWDRTTQIVTLTKLIADPYYRTIKGFQFLIRREWIDFGHKFCDRTGLLNKDSSEVAPVFLQWLDCVYQLLRQFPTDFEFTKVFLIKLAIHSYSGLFGTFLWNSALQQRESRNGSNEGASIWSYLNELNPQFVNAIYSKSRVRRLRPRTGIEHMVLWSELYIGPSVECRLNVNEGSTFCSSGGMTASLHDEPDRSSLHRAHSAESLSNCDGNICLSPSNSSLVHGPSHPPVISNCVVPSTVVEPDATPDSESAPLSVKNTQNTQRQFHPETMIDVDGLTKVVDVLQQKMRKIIDEKDKEILELKRKFAKLKADQLQQVDSPPSSVSEECNETSFSYESTFSIIDEPITIRNLSEISRKSRYYNKETNRCGECQHQFNILRRKDKCSECGAILCSKCLPHTRHDVNNGEGRQLPICEYCYSSLLSKYDTLPSSEALRSSPSRPLTHKSSSSSFLGGSSHEIPENGQTVFG